MHAIAGNRVVEVSPLKISGVTDELGSSKSPNNTNSSRKLRNSFRAL